MADKCCVFVDGENLRYSIIDLFRGEFEKTDYLPKRANWAAFFDWLVKQIGEDVRRLRTYWYAIEHIDFTPYLPLPKNDHATLKQILSRHPPFKQQLDKPGNIGSALLLNELAAKCEEWATHMKSRFEGWRRIQERIALTHRAIEFRRAGAIRYNLFTRELGNEKAVDVKLAMDMNELRDIYDIALIVSGDQDYVPAVQVAKDSGKTVINVAFEARSGRLLPGGARRLNQMTDSAITVKYQDLKGFLNL